MAAKNPYQNGMWTPHKELLSMVEFVVGQNKLEYLSDLEMLLTKCRPAIISLLENPERSGKQREEVKNAPKDGIQLEGGHGLTKLSDLFVTEALALSDALNLSEFVCVDLLISAEQQLSNFPGLSRGLVAALLYHDGRRCLVNALKLLLTAKTGMSWALELDQQITQAVDKFAEKLFDDGIINKILQKLRDISVQGEIEKLDKGKVVGNPKHRKQLTELITEQRNSLADCLFCWACQSPFGQSECVAVIDFLKDCIPDTSDGCYDHVTLKVILSLLVSWSTSAYEVLLEEPEALKDSKFPVFQDGDFVSKLHQAVIRPDNQHWRTPSIKVVLQFVWAVFLRFVRQFENLDAYEEVFAEDEELLDLALQSDALRLIKSCIVSADSFFHEEYCVKTIHGLITNTILKYPMKIKDLRNRGDENAKILQAHLQEGIEPPKGLRHDFQDLLLLVGALYKNDPLGLELSKDYWCPGETFGGVFSPKPLSAVKLYLRQKQVLLNKFVRLAGDLIPQAVFTSYVKMLTGLSTNQQSAQCCFNLLNSDGSIGGSPTLTATWDHFFQSFKQYYSSLRQDAASAEHHAHVHHHHNISPEELSALESVLELIHIVAEHSENVRIAFCDNTYWLPIASFFGLVGCPVPSSLKAALLNTLASFAKSPEISAIIWQSLEATQILATVSKDATGKQETGLKVELEEVESRDETYPQTRAFLRLINTLTEITIPTTLGAGYRVPGFIPYLDFLRDNVFLRFKSRAYQNPSEKWMVAKEVLEIFAKILRNYEPLPEQFVEQNVEIQGVNFGKAAKHPGHEIMLHMLNDTPMFRLVMNIIDILWKEFDEANDGNKANEEKAVFYCLKLIEYTLEKQTKFNAMLRNQNSSVMVTPIEKLLLSINPSTAEADYPYKIARFMTLNNVSPDLTLAVVRILCVMNQSPDMQNEIIGILSSRKIERDQLLVGFCEFLEQDIPEEIGRDRHVSFDNDDGLQDTDASVRNAIRHNILNLLLSTLHQPSPNLAQFLLGFDLQTGVSKTVFQDAGVARFPKTCFHSIISLLNNGLDTPNGPSCISETPMLAELMYQLIYFLCAHPETGVPCQRYLRTNHDFFAAHAARLPFLRPSLLSEDNTELFILLSNQQSWFMKTIAIEIKVASQTRLRSSMIRLLDLLYGQQNQRSRHDHFQVPNPDPASAYKGRPQGGPHNNLASAVLNDLELTQDYPSPYTSNMFQLSAVEQLIASCEERSEDTGIIICNVKMLHRVVMAELNSAQGMANIGQRPEILKEVEAILAYAVERNSVRRSLGAKRHAFEAWRQVVETSFAICQYDVFPAEARVPVILNLLQDMIAKVSNENAIPELLVPVAGAILMLMAQYHNVAVQLASSSDGPVRSRMDMSHLFRIFQGIVNCLCSVGASNFKTRCSFYGAILYYMQIGKLHTSVREKGSSNIFGPVSKESWEANTLSFLAKQGESFMDMVCRDACNGPEIGEMLAFAVLDSIVSIDWQERWSGFLSSRGYLRHLVESIPKDDTKLLAVFSSDGDALKTVYTLESKLDFLTRFAKSEIGAQILLQCGLTSKLIECEFIDHRPDDSNLALHLTSFAYSQHYDPLSPSKMEQYRIVLSAVLRLIKAIVSSLGPGHQEFISQLQEFILAHEEAFLDILQAKTPCKTVQCLQELSLVTSVVSLLRPRREDHKDPESVGEDGRRMRSSQVKIQRVLLGLMQSFSSKEYCNEITKTCVERDSSNDAFEQATSVSEVTTATVRRILLQIRSNLISYARSVVSSLGLTGAYCNVIFSPVLIDISESKKMGHHDVSIRHGASKKASMSVLVEELDRAVDDVKAVIHAYMKYQKKIEEIEDLSGDETSQLLSQENVVDIDRLSNQQRRIIARKILQQLVDLNDDQACLNIHITLSLDSSFGKKNKQSSSVNMGKFSVTKEEVRQLKVEAKSVLTDKVMKSVLEAESLYGKTRSRVQFISAMVRRIQGLVKLHSS
eukprot:gene5068-181_t